MADYTKKTGYSGTLTIRDFGRFVELWISCSDPATHTGGLAWSYVLNGSNPAFTVALPKNFQHRLLATLDVTYSQTIELRIGPSGTNGIGGPTNLSAWISRATVPHAPSTASPWGWSNVKDTTASLLFEGIGDGGSPIREWQSQRAKDAGFTVDLAHHASNGRVDYTGLTPKTNYWARVRGRNDVGWGPWSGVVQMKTQGVPDTGIIPNAVGVFNDTIAYNITAPGAGGVSILELQTQLSTSPSFASIQATLSGAVPVFEAVHGVVRNTEYHARTRARNSYGWGAWSPTKTVRTTLEVPSVPYNWTFTDITSVTAYSSIPAVADNGGGALTSVNVQIESTGQIFSSTVFSNVFIGKWPVPGEALRGRMRVWNAKGPSAWSEYQDLLLRNDVPGAPSDEWVYDITENSARLTWTQDADPRITGYAVRLARNWDFSQSLSSYTTIADAREFTFTGLQPGTEYWAQVWPNSDLGPGGFSYPRSFTTSGVSPDSAPGWLRVGGVWKSGSYWMKVSGVWKAATLWQRVSGTWRKF